MVSLPGSLAWAMTKGVRLSVDEMGPIDGSVAALEISDLGDEFAVFQGASAGLLADEDVEEAAAALEAGTSAALLVFENRWAAPFAAAVRRSGGQLVASGRISIQAMLAALDAAETAS
jgi:hypothetical protein